MTVKEINAVMHDMCSKAPVVLNLVDTFDLHGLTAQSMV